MRSALLDDERRTVLATGVAVDLIVGADDRPATYAEMVRVTVPPKGTMPRHDHGESDAFLIPLDGRLLLYGAGGRIEALEAGRVVVVPAHESVSVRNPAARPASMLVCFAPSAAPQTRHWAATVPAGASAVGAIDVDAAMAAARRFKPRPHA